MLTVFLETETCHIGIDIGPHVDNLKLSSSKYSLYFLVYQLPYKMNQVSMLVLLVFLMASLLRYQEATVVRRRPNLLTTLLPLRPSSRNISNHAVNKTNRVKKPCITDTPLAPSIKLVRKLMSEHNYVLQINANGVVNGTSDIKSPYGEY